MSGVPQGLKPRIAFAELIGTAQACSFKADWPACSARRSI